jgi:aspartyl-tRNA(Asn)/glutamyl-tRNA(Gln) amidotransferase subunit A
MPDIPTALTIEQFGRRLRDRDLTAAAVTDACLRRIEADNARLNAFIRVMADDARRQAADADRDIAAGRDRGPLHGVPIAIKDLIDIRGLPTTAASRVREGHVAAADAPVIARLRDAGAILIGKTNLDEFAYGTTSENSAFGPVRNPHDQGRSPGGSSGGSAVSVATGMALAALGTDTGGSIRIPAAACGTVGLKPTYGEVPVDLVVPLSRTFDHVGPFARTVCDAWLVYRALLGSAGQRALTPRTLAGVRLGLPRGYFCDLLEADVQARFDEAVSALKEGGAHVDEAGIPHASSTPAVYVHIHSSEGAEYHAGTLASAPERYTRPVRLRLETGGYVLAEDYVRAMHAREVLRREVDAALDNHDALVLPTLPIQAPPFGAESVVVNGTSQPVRALMLRNTQLFNVTGHPAISMPCGVTSQGLPCGLQLVGRRFDTDALLRLAHACEAHLTSSSDRSRDRRTSSRTARSRRFE